MTVNFFFFTLLTLFLGLAVIESERLSILVKYHYNEAINHGPVIQFSFISGLIYGYIIVPGVIGVINTGFPEPKIITFSFALFLLSITGIPGILALILLTGFCIIKIQRRNMLLQQLQELTQQPPTTNPTTYNGTLDGTSNSARIRESVRQRRSTCLRVENYVLR